MRRFVQSGRPLPAPVPLVYDNSMNIQLLEQLAARLIAGQLSVPEFVGRMQDSGIADVGPAQVDLDRHRRCGFPEVVFSQGKTVEAIAKIFHAQLEHGSGRAGHADVGRAGGRVAFAVPRGQI